MIAAFYLGSFPLSNAERLLLEAATRPRADAEAAWQCWQAQCEIGTADPRSQALFGMVYANLIAVVGGPDAALLKGVYKRIWYANQILLAQLPLLLEHLAARGIPAMLLHDAALVSGHYPDIGYRAIRSIDLQVHSAHWEVCAEPVVAAGWDELRHESFTSPGGLSMRAFSGPERRRLRLWTGLFAVEPRKEMEARLWADGRNVDVSGRLIPALGPVEQLLCVSAEAFRSPRAPLFLGADALRLVHALDSICDWTRLVWKAQRYEYILPLRGMLSFVEDVLSAELPPWVLPTLRRMAISHAELLQFHRACEGLPLRLKSACLRWFRPLRAGAARGR